MAEYPKIVRPNQEYGIGECFALLNEYEMRAHWLHLNCNNFELHKATDFVVEAIQDKKDGILELILGYSPKEMKCEINLELTVTPDAPMKLANDLWEYAHKYYEIFEKLEYADLANELADIQKIASKFKYLLTLK